MGDFLKKNWTGEDASDLQKQLRSDMRTWFGSVPASLLALFKAMTGGVEWEKMGEALMTISTIYGLVFVGFLGFALFGIMNVVTAVFVEQALSATAREKTEEIRTIGSHVDACLLAMDEDSKGFLTKAEFMKLLESDELRDLLRNAHMERAEIVHIFDILQSREGEDFVLLDTLSTKCKQLLATPRTVDVLTLKFEIGRLQREFHSFCYVTEGHLRHLCA